VKNRLLRTLNYFGLLKIKTDIEQKHDVLEECIFHSITNFHLTKNRVSDVMHDLLEGVCRYDLGQFLNRLTKDN